MVPAGNKGKHLSSVNHTTKTTTILQTSSSSSSSSLSSSSDFTKDCRHPILRINFFLIKVILDKNLSWTDHVNKTETKFAKYYCLSYKTEIYLNTEVLKYQCFAL